MLSGFGAMVVEARPGDTLYGLHAMFFDEPRVNDDQITLSAKADLAKVQQMIDQGQWAQAQNQLAEVSSTVQSMNDGASRQDLMDEVNLLNTRVEIAQPERDAAAARIEAAARAGRLVHFAGLAQPVHQTVDGDQHGVHPAPSASTSPSPARLRVGIGITGTTRRRRRWHRTTRLRAWAAQWRRWNPSASDVASLSEASAYPRQ